MSVSLATFVSPESPSVADKESTNYPGLPLRRRRALCARWGKHSRCEPRLLSSDSSRLRPADAPWHWRCLVRRALHAPHLRTGAILRTPELAQNLTASLHLPRRQCPAPRRCQRSPSCRCAEDGSLGSEEHVFKVFIDAMLVDGADHRVFGREVLQFVLPMDAAVTFASGSTSPWTLPRCDGCPWQRLCLRWLRTCVMYPSSS